MLSKIAKVATALKSLSQEEMNGLVRRRLLGEYPQDPLPDLYRNEDPSDILIDSYELLKNSRQELTTLGVAAENFIKEVLNWDNSYVRNNSFAVMEIIFLCAGLGLKDVAHIIGCLGLRDVHLKLKLPNDEPLSNLSLRAIVGLIAPEGFFYMIPRTYRE